MNGILNNFTKKTNLQFPATINVEENTEQIFFVDNPEYILVCDVVLKHIKSYFFFQIIFQHKFCNLMIQIKSFEYLQEYV